MSACTLAKPRDRSHGPWVIRMDCTRACGVSESRRVSQPCLAANTSSVAHMPNCRHCSGERRRTRGGTGINGSDDTSTPGNIRLTTAIATGQVATGSSMLDESC